MGEEWNLVLKFVVILVVVGKSLRFGMKQGKKFFVMFGDKVVWLYFIEWFLKCDDVQQVILVFDFEDCEDFQFCFGVNVVILGIEVVDGGVQCVDLVRKGLVLVGEDIDFVVVYDVV